MKSRLPVWACMIGLSSGFAGWAFRSVAEGSHPVLVGSGVFGVTFAVCLIFVAIHRSF